jgi:uncharacterized protein YjbI with pentapeptide repeats
MEIRKNVFHEYLRDGEKDKFNAEVSNLKKPVDLENCNLQGVDLREVNLVNANLKDSYLKSADLRGADLSHAKLSGASLHKARIGGVLFPKNIEANEIRLSVEYGTRLREK